MLTETLLGLLFVMCATGDISVDPEDGGYNDVVLAIENGVPPDDTLVTNLKVRPALSAHSETTYRARKHRIRKARTSGKPTVTGCSTPSSKATWYYVFEVSCGHELEQMMSEG